MVLINPSRFDLKDNNGPMLERVSIAMMVLSFLAMVLRFTARKMKHQPLLWDDWFIPIAVVFAWITCLVEIIATHKANFGRHIELASPSEIQLFAKFLYIVQITYAPGIAALKLSVLLFYHRLFAIPTIKKPLMVLGVITIAWLIAMELMAIFPCTPIDYFWDKEKSGTCINQTAHFLAVAIPNVATDILIIFIPTPILWKLKMAMSQRIALISVFLISGLVVVLSCLRLVTVLQADSSKDVTWAFFPHGLFNVLEMNIGILCACLPSMTPLLRLITRKKNTLPASGDSPMNRPSYSVRKYWNSKRGNNIPGLSVLEETNLSYTRLHTATFNGSCDPPTTSIKASTPSQIELEEIERHSDKIHVEKDLTWSENRG